MWLAFCQIFGYFIIQHLVTLDSLALMYNKERQHHLCN